MDPSRIKPATVALVAAVALSGIGVFCLRLWQPERQVRLHNTNLLDAVGDRNFKRISRFLAPEYSDPWNESGEVALERLREVMRQYFAVTVREEVIRVESEKGSGIVTAHVNLDGRGTAFAEMVTRRVNGLTEPFVFYWRKGSWQPWDWKLARVENEDLHLRSSSGFLD